MVREPNGDQESALDEIAIVHVKAKLPTGGYTLTYHGEDYDVNVVPEHTDDSFQYLPVVDKVASLKSLLAPMAGSVISVNVAVGDEVHEGQELCVLEAMKMQNVLRAEANGIVAEVKVEAGGTVGVKDLIVRLE